MSAGEVSGQHNLTAVAMMGWPHFMRAREAQTGTQHPGQELQNPNAHEGVPASHVGLCWSYEGTGWGSQVTAPWA